MNCLTHVSAEHQEHHGIKGLVIAHWVISGRLTVEASPHFTPQNNTGHDNVPHASSVESTDFRFSHAMSCASVYTITSS
jgi:hypothetical protein